MVPDSTRPPFTADGRIAQEELRLLEMLAQSLPIDRLAAAAIERGARARHMTP